MNRIRQIASFLKDLSLLLLFIVAMILLGTALIVWMDL